MSSLSSINEFTHITGAPTQFGIKFVRTDKANFGLIYKLFFEEEQEKTIWLSNFSFVILFLLMIYYSFPFFLVLENVKKISLHSLDQKRLKKKMAFHPNGQGEW